MNPIPHKIEDWLQTRVTAASGVLLDVGAHHGAFTEALLNAGLCQKAHLFEPHPDNLAILQNKFGSRSEITIHPIALGAEPGIRTLRSTKDTATASILPYLGNQCPIFSQSIQCNTLDAWAEQRQIERVSIIKIDTQGADLSVLSGAQQLISTSRPLIVVEAIFLPLYADQADPTDLLLWGRKHGYRLGGWFNEHWTSNGDLAFADLVLTPASIDACVDTTYIARDSASSLEQQIKDLEIVCAERLKLIEQLHAEAEKRLRLIEKLSRQLHPPSAP